MKKVTEISEATKVSLSLVGAVAAFVIPVVVSVAISVSVGDAKLEARVTAQEAALAAHKSDADVQFTKLSEKIDVLIKQGSKMEGVLEELRRK